MKDLHKKYKYIVAYGRLVGSFDYYVEQKLKDAELVDAPLDTWAIDLDKDGKIQKLFTLSTTPNKVLIYDLERLSETY